MENRYWFKGMKLSIHVIAECLNISQSYINANANKFGISIQEYIRGIQNCTPKPEIRNYRTDNTHHSASKRPARLIEGLTLREISMQYDIPKSTLNARYTKGIRTIKEIVEYQPTIM